MPKWNNKLTHEKNLAAIITAKPKDAEDQALVAIAYLLAKIERKLGGAAIPKPMPKAKAAGKPAAKRTAKKR